MITYEKFKDIIVKYIQFSKVEDQLYKMGINREDFLTGGWGRIIALPS